MRWRRERELVLVKEVDVEEVHVEKEVKEVNVDEEEVVVDVVEEEEEEVMIKKNGCL